MARPARALLKDERPDLAAEIVDRSLLPTLSVGADRKVEWKCPKCGGIYEARPYNRTNAKNPTGCPYCAGKKVLRGFNDLATTDPDVAALCADPDDAYAYTRASNKKVRWRCENGHEWTAPVSRLTQQGSRCPYCSGRLSIAGKTDLATVRPDLASELVDRSLAKDLKQCSERVVEWRCPRGHVYKSRVISRTLRKNGCPYCSNRQVLVGFNDLATTDPDVAACLVHPEEAREVTRGSERKLEWRCENHPDETYFMSVYYKVLGIGCPICHRSKGEKELCSAVRALLGPNVDVRTNVRGILPGRRELDIYVPSRHVALEYNGVLWHSEAAKADRHAHEKKASDCESAGITLFQVWEDDWRDRRDVVIVSLAHKLHAIDRLGAVLPEIDHREMEKHGARTLSPAMITGASAAAFLTAHHVQGATTATRHFGLIDTNGTLWAVLSVRSPNASARARRKAGEWEIVRYATMGEVPGGFGRLLKFARESIGADVSKWVTFSDRCASDGGLYAACGFTKARILPVDYRYVGQATRWRRVSKERFQLKRFRDDPNLLYQDGWTESMAAKANHLFRIWDAGKVRWERDA